MSDFTLMSSINVSYKPQNGQKFRCSSNFSTWNTPTNGELLFTVTNVPEGYPPPIFAVDHDKSGSDSRWYSCIYDHREISVSYENGEAGEHNIYIGTTIDDFPSDLDGSKYYTVNVYSKNN